MSGRTGTGLPDGHPGGLNLTARLFELGGYAVNPAGSFREPEGEITAPLSVLDLGAGEGAAVRFLRGNGYRAEGIDLFPGSKDVKNQDMCRLPWGEASYDICLAECSLSSCKERPEALREAYRVLKPLGKLLVSDVFFRKKEDLGPQLPGDLSWEGWRRTFAGAGFRICAMKDESRLWKEFFLESLWNGNADECFSEFYRTAGRAGCGYYLACLEKGAEHGTV